MCQACTFRNPSSYLACDMCSAERYTTTVEELRQQERREKRQLQHVALSPDADGCGHEPADLARGSGAEVAPAATPQDEAKDLPPLGEYALDCGCLVAAATAQGHLLRAMSGPSRELPQLACLFYCPNQARLAAHTARLAPRLPGCLVHAGLPCRPCPNVSPAAGIRRGCARTRRYRAVGAAGVWPTGDEA